MIEGWAQQIAAAQRQTEYEIQGRRYQRIPYGKERGFSASRPCSDCAVHRGQLHVPGCDIERCPRCSGQKIACGCSDPIDDDDDLELN
jgi:hypothetical protein